MRRNQCPSHSLRTVLPQGLEGKESLPKSFYPVDIAASGATVVSALVATLLHESRPGLVLFTFPQISSPSLG